MSAKTVVPMQVLSQGLADAIAGRRVRTALFTTFTFDPGFFELNVLPVLFDQSFSQVDKVRYIHLEDALRTVDHIAVYYDRGALAQDAQPARLDYRRIDVRRATGAFHPKLVLLLIDQADGDGEEDGQAPLQSLIVGVQSANLTRAGWWENVECAHFEEVPDERSSGERCPYRPDLMAILHRIQKATGPGEEHDALDRIQGFLLERVNKDRISRARAAGRYYTRLFGGYGRDDFSTWLAGLGLGPGGWNLEVISPYFDPTGAGPLESLIEALGPREVRIYLPRDLDGTALVTEETYWSVYQTAWWGTLPGYVVQRSGGETAAGSVLRRVHAKIYRLWKRSGPELLITGSVNLTSSAHSHGGAGNLEAAFFVDVSNQGSGKKQWWLKRIESDAERFVDDSPREDEGLEPAPIDLSLRYDWGTGALSYRLAGVDDGFELFETTGAAIHRVGAPEPGAWVDFPPAVSSRVADILRSTSFLQVRHSKGEWRVLVREENMGHRPSLLADLTPEEILEYWSLLTAEQRAAFIEAHAEIEDTLEGLQIVKRQQLESRDTMFDRFAGIYHAFGCLRGFVDRALLEGRYREAETRLFGAKYDSLPALLQKTLDNEDWDPVVRYVTFLCARQLRDFTERKWPELFVGLGGRSARLDSLLDCLDDVRRQLPLSEIEDAAAFLEWYEPAFLDELSFAGEET